MALLTSHYTFLVIEHGDQNWFSLYKVPPNGSTKTNRLENSHLCPSLIHIEPSFAPRPSLAYVTKLSQEQDVPNALLPSSTPDHLSPKNTQEQSCRACTH